MKASMKIVRKVSLLFLFSIGLVWAGQAQDVEGIYVFPEENQTEQQQKIDESKCFEWAHQEVLENPTPTPEKREHQTLKEAGKGAVGGAVIGAIVGGMDEGAILGAGAGAIRGHRKSNEAERIEETQVTNDFKRAYASCLKAKGYSVE